jgi:hypothetical protein
VYQPFTDKLTCNDPEAVYEHALGSYLSTTKLFSKTCRAEARDALKTYLGISQALPFFAVSPGSAVLNDRIRELLDSLEVVSEYIFAINSS